jgi:EipB-like
MTRAPLTRWICSVAAVLACAGPAFSAQLAPHRAFYTLEAARVDDGSGFSQINGKLAYELTGSECEGYAVSYRIANRYVQSEGQSNVTDTQLTSFESGDGLELDLRQKQFTNSNLENENTIKVRKPKVGAAGIGEMTGGPGDKNFETDAKSIFPTEFQKFLVDAALRGETRYNAFVYEGSDADKSMKAISFIGAKKTADMLKDSASSESVKGLGKMPYWPVSVSYYAADATGDDPPIYQASFNMLENGISTDLLLDYGPYALAGKLSKLEMLKAEACN